MSENISIIIGYVIVGILFIFLSYKVFKKVKDVPNKIIQLLYAMGLIVIGIGLYSTIHRGVPFIYKTIASFNNTESLQESNTPQTEIQATGNIQSGTTVSGVIINDSPQPEEEIVSWSTLQEKLKHIPVTERRGNTAGN